MRFTISRDSLIAPLQLVSNAVERRQTLPVLSDILVVLDDQELTLTATDLEVELVAKVAIPESGESGQITVPARKFLDICRSLPPKEIDFVYENQKVTLKCGANKFTLSTIAAGEFPAIDETVGTHTMQVNQAKLKSLMDRTAFAMAQQDVRYYLNGMLFEINANQLKSVSTDGHRLALSELSFDAETEAKTEAIIPRKGITELQRLLDDSDENLQVILGTNHLRVSTPGYIFTSKLIDGKFPDYDRVLPKNGDKQLVSNREDLRDAFARAAILCNEKYRGIRMNLSSGNLTITANNPEQEEAVIDLAVDYSGEELEIGFNVSYVLDVLNTLKTEQVQWTLGDSNSSALIEGVSDDMTSLYVVMPMRL